MTAVVEVNLLCNGLGRGRPCPSRELLTFPTQSIKSARIMAREKGWKVYRETLGTGTKHMDACPLCAKTVPGLTTRTVELTSHNPAISAGELIGNTLQRRKP